MTIDAPRYRDRIRRYWHERNAADTNRRRYARESIRKALRRLKDAGEGRPVKPRLDAHNTQPSRPAGRLFDPAELLVGAAYALTLAAGLCYVALTAGSAI